MKRELPYAVESQPHLSDSLSRTRSSKTNGHTANAPPESNGSASPDLNQTTPSKIPSQSRLVVYTRNKRFKSSISDGTSAISDQSKLSFVRTVEEEDGVVDLVGKRLRSSNPDGTPVISGESEGSFIITGKEDGVADFENGISVILNESEGKFVRTEEEDDLVNKADLDTVMVENTRLNRRLKSSKSNGASVISSEGNLVKNLREGVVGLVNKEKSKAELDMERRLTRSTMKLVKVENGNLESETLHVGPESFDMGELQEVKVGLEGECGVTILGTRMKKLEKKISRKIGSKGSRPSTVKELFETGLLEGYPVFYNGGKKGILLRGTIKDIGILCFCSLCNGSKVIAPSNFEIHACKSYRRASEYICLENGKSLLEVVKECRKSSLKRLEETIQSVIGPLPVTESIICQNCKGSFRRTHVAKVGQLCDSCLMSVKSEASPNTATVQTRSSNSVFCLKSCASTKVIISSQNNSQGKTKRKSKKPAIDFISPASPSVHITSQTKSQLKITKHGSSEQAFVPKSNASASVCISPPNNSQEKIFTKLSNSVSIPRSSKSASLFISPQNKSRWKITKKDLRMHKLVFEDDGLPDGTALAYYSRGKKLLDGYKKGSGIFCSCCKTEVSPSQFEAHAGWASRRKPYCYIYTSNGVSLHELAISLLRGRKNPSKDSDDLCIICADGGKLVLCDGCPRAFHKVCASLSSIPRGKWFCKYCQNMFQRERYVENNANAVAAGRVSGVDPIEQIAQRCIRIVKNPEEAEVIACVLCRGYDFSKSGFGPRTVILCDQCEKEYHIGCLKKHKMADLKELPKGKWFCCMECRRIYAALQNLLICGAEKLPDSLLDVIFKKHKEKGLDTVADCDVRWRVLCGKISSRETRFLLSEAISIFHDCFDPIVDSVTGRDFIPSMVYGRNIRGQDFGGMYCAILTVNSSVVSAAIFRVFGQDMAELPLVATCNRNQGKGYFQLLFSRIERYLAILNVRTLVLPAAVEAESIWTDKFGFRRILPEQLSNYRKTCWQMITFKGTSMLEKKVPACRITRQDVADFDVPVE